MIPQVVPRKQLIAANGVFTLTLNAAFAVGFALLGPLVVNAARGAGADPRRRRLLPRRRRLLLDAPAVAARSPRGRAARRSTADEAEEAMGSTLGQLREGIAFIRANPRISWSLLYLGIAASLVGVLGVLGPDFAQESLRLEPKDFVVVVLPLGFGIVMGILILNNFGHLLPAPPDHRGRPGRPRHPAVPDRGRRADLALAAARRGGDRGSPSLADFTSLLAIVVFIALLAGIAYAFVAIPAQTQLQEDLPEDVRGRVFGVLNMLVSVASFLPIIIVGPVADVVGTTIVLYVVGDRRSRVSGVVSIVTRGPLKPSEAKAMATGPRRRRAWIRLPSRRPPRWSPRAADALAPHAAAGAAATVSAGGDRGSAGPGARTPSTVAPDGGSRGGPDPVAERPRRRPAVTPPRTSSRARRRPARHGPDRDARGHAGPGWVEAIAIDGGRVVAAGRAGRCRGPGVPRTRRRGARARRGRDPRASPMPTCTSPRRRWPPPRPPGGRARPRRRSSSGSAGGRPRRRTRRLDRGCRLGRGPAGSLADGRRPRAGGARAGSSRCGRTTTTPSS